MRTAPQMRSMYWRDSPASARSWSSSTRLLKAWSISANDHGVGLLGEVLERADDLLLGGELLDGRPHQVREARDLPALEVHAVSHEGFALGLVGRAGESVRHVGGDELAVGGEALPAVLGVKLELNREVHLQDVPAQTDGHAVLPAPRKAVDGSVVDLVGLGFAGGGEQARDLLRRVVLLGDYEPHVGTCLTACPARAARSPRGST